MATEDFSISPASPDTLKLAMSPESTSQDLPDAREEQKPIPLIKDGKGKGKARERDTTAYG